MKKVLKWLGLALLVPPLLVLLLVGLLYLSPVQNRAVDVVARIASSETGMQIGVGEVNLDFPLDLGLDDVLVLRQGDTIASIGHATVDVRLLPLFSQRIVVDELSLTDAVFNTTDFISDLQLRGRVGRLALRSPGIGMSDGRVQLSDARLSDADVTVLLSDTAVVDTTESGPTAWLIALDSLVVHRSRVEVHTPGDSLRIEAYLGHTRASGVLVDLLNEHYALDSFDWRDGSFRLDQGLSAVTSPAGSVSEGIDYNHLMFSGIGLGVDSVVYHSPDLRFVVRHGQLHERSGLTLTHLEAAVSMDSATVFFPRLSISTPYSYIHARGQTDFTVADSIAPGMLDASVRASVGKSDLMLFMGSLGKELQAQWPDWPLALSADVKGNMSEARVSGFDLTLPSTLHVQADGIIGFSPTNNIALNIAAEGYDLGLLSAFVPAFGKDFTLPKGLTLRGEINAHGSVYGADLTLADGPATVAARGHLDGRVMGYEADVDVEGLDLSRFLPIRQLGLLTATLTASGKGTDLQKPDTRLEANGLVHHLGYNGLNIDSTLLAATLADGRLLASIDGRNRLFGGTLSAEAQFGSADLQGKVSANLHRVDLYAMGVTDHPLTIGVSGDLSMESNFKERHRVSGYFKDLYLRDSVTTFHPENIGVLLRTDRDTTLARLQSGTFIAKLDAQGGYESVLERIGQLAETLKKQMEQRTIDYDEAKALLPVGRLYVTSRDGNSVADLIRASTGISFAELEADLSTSPTAGVNGTSHIYRISVDSTLIDTVRVNLVEKRGGLTFNGQATNNKKNPGVVFNALFDGRLQEHGGSVGVRFYDGEGRLGVRLGTQAVMVDSGIRFRLLPDQPTIGYKQFRMNADNYLLLQRNRRLLANVSLTSDDGTGVKVYSPEQQDSTLLQDLTVSLHQFDLGQLTEALPFLPSITGSLDGDFHLTMNRESQVSVASDVQIGSMTYESSPVGNVSTELVYLQRENDTHAVEAVLMLEGKEVGSLRGEYQDSNQGQLNATLDLTRFPLDLANGFIEDQIIGFEGFAEGTLSVKGTLRKLDVDGLLTFDSTALVSQPYGVRLRLDKTPVTISDARLLFDGFKLYGYNNQPLDITGNVDFHDTERITLDMRVVARNFQLINSRQTSRSISWGKAFVNVFTRLSGRLDQMNMRGRVDVLGTTDLNYILLDSPLSVDNQMDELVRFTNLSDSIVEVVNRPQPSGITADLTISIDQGTHVRCALNVDQTNYVDLFGGGDLRMKYGRDGITMTGRYTIGDGQMKYSLPVIPLKTFTIKEGSYVEFTGDPSNPRLNLTATENVKASVTQGGETSRRVNFDCGVVITKQLSDMGLEFIISAPEDNSLNGELLSMSAEERAKLAVTMLTTGMYLTDGNTSSFTMNSALSSFLQSEINNITGNALKTLDLSVGVDNVTDASGTMHTDYSFKFAKRFWNNRLRIQIGGKVSSDQNVNASGQEQSFFDNVSMEYRLSPTGNQYVGLFYKQNAYDWLEGYTSEYGGGFIWRRQAESFWDIFRFKSRRQVSMRPDAMQVPAVLRADSVRTSSVVPADTVKSSLKP